MTNSSKSSSLSARDLAQVAVLLPRLDRPTADLDASERILVSVLQDLGLVSARANGSVVLTTAGRVAARAL